MKLIGQATKLSAIALVAIMSMTGCQKRDIELNDRGNDPLANTYITVSLNIGTMSSAPRAALRGEDVEHHNKHTTEPEWKGRDKINKLIIYLFDDENAPAKVQNFEGNNVPQPDQHGKVTLKPWKTTEGEKTVFAIINPSAAIESALTAANTSLTTFKAAYEKDYDFLVRDQNEAKAYWDSPANAAVKVAWDASAYGSNTEAADRVKGYLFRYGMVKPEIAFSQVKLGAQGEAVMDEQGEPEFSDVIMMTGTPVSKNILPNVSEAQATAGTNTLSLVLRRVVAQAVVTLNGQTFYYDVNTDMGFKNREASLSIGNDGAKLHRLRWTVQQFEQKSYLSSKGNMAQNTQSTKYNFISNASQSYDTSGYYYLPMDQVANEVEKWLDVPSFYHDVTTDNLVAFTKETSPAVLANPTLYSGWSDPKNEPYFFTAPHFITETTHPYDEASYRKGNTAYFVVAGILEPGVGQMGVGQTVTAPNYNYITNKVTASTLYYGLADGKYYTDYATAYKANNGGVAPTTVPTTAAEAKKLKDNLVTYVDGYCYYVAWVNPDTNDSKTWKTSPVVRNNFYHMNIAGFTKPGYSGIPLIPGGDHPLTPDPDDPVPGPDEPLKDAETHMAATVTVQGWGVHAYEVTF